MPCICRGLTYLSIYPQYEKIFTTLKNIKSNANNPDLRTACLLSLGQATSDPALIQKTLSIAETSKDFGGSAVDTYRM